MVAHANTHMNTIHMQKQELRTKFLTLRRDIPVQTRNGMNRTIADTLKGTVEYQQAHTICTYTSLADEVDTTWIISDALEKNDRTIILPKVVGPIIDLYIIHAWSDLTPGVFGILEPKTTNERVTVERIDLFIVPGLIFDRQGNRIGYGKGYYDRLLMHATVPKIALAYDLQMIDTVPNEPTDIPVDLCITEKQIYRF